MQVSRWGNSLAIRLPATVVEALQLQEGDHIAVHVCGDREFEIGRDGSREAALKRLRRLRRPLPPDFTFHRNAVHDR